MIPSHQEKWAAEIQPPLSRMGLGPVQRIKLGLQLLRVRFKEYLLHDSGIFRFLVGWFGLLAVKSMLACGRTRQGFELLCRLHRADFCNAANNAASRLVREAAAAAARGADHPILRVYRDHIANSQPTPRTKKFFDHPEYILGSIAIVLKAPSDAEKGVLLLQYSYTFPLFAKLFDLPRIAERYYIVLEPTWRGYCDLDILSYSQFPFPVFVQAYEPRDAEFLSANCPNLIPLPLGNNWWLDYRIFAPRANVAKEFDVVMNAGWAGYKRHDRFFRALRTLNRAGYRLRVLLVGYPIDKSRERVAQLAEYYEVLDQIHIEERVPYDEMGSLVSRAKVGVLWSRNEGSNRAIVELMLAGLPCLLREGHNYGHRYDHINDATGDFSTESELPQKLLDMVRSFDRYSPREWVLRKMSCQIATAVLHEAIGRTAAARREPWFGHLAVKVNQLDSMAYWSRDDFTKFQPDYAFLCATAHRPSVTENRPDDHNVRT